MKHLATNNPTWGYAGALEQNLALTSWDTLSAFLRERYPSASAADVRNLLDSKAGQHLANAASHFDDDTIKAIGDKKTGRWLDKEMADIKAQFEEC